MEAILKIEKYVETLPINGITDAKTIITKPRQDIKTKDLSSTEPLLLPIYQQATISGNNCKIKPKP